MTDENHAWHTGGASEDATRGDTVQSVERCFAVIEALADGPHEGATMAELALITSLPRPVVRRLLLTLQGLGYAEPEGRRWYLTPAILRLSARYSSAERLIRICVPHTEKLARQLDESVFVSRLQHGQSRVVVASAIQHMTSVSVHEGQDLPLHATAAGQVLIAWLDELPSIVLSTHTSRTLRTPAALARRLEQVRTDGYAIAVAEIEDGVVAAAVPIRNRSGAVIASLSTVAPLGRFSPHHARDHAVPLLLAGARAIERDLAGPDAASRPSATGE